MVIIDLIIRLINPRKRRVLALAEMNMDSAKFLLFKKEFMREFGNSGFIRDLESEFTKKGKERNGAVPAEWTGQK